jgi:hypothetical protein
MDFSYRFGIRSADSIDKEFLLNIERVSLIGFPLNSIRSVPIITDPKGSPLFASRREGNSNEPRPLLPKTADVVQIMETDGTAEEKILRLKTSFFQSSRLASGENGEMWEIHKKNPDFLLEVSKYVQKTLSELLRQRPIESVSASERQASVYDEIEFCVFLLGANGNLDILEDLRTNECSEFSSLMARYRTEIEELAATEAEAGNGGVSAFVEGFFAISEVANKIAYLNSIKRSEKELISFRLIQIIEKETEALIEVLSHSEKTEKTNRLNLILAKLAINYSHLPYLKEPTSEEDVVEILAMAEAVRKSIKGGYEMAKKVEF